MFCRKYMKVTMWEFTHRLFMYFSESIMTSKTQKITFVDCSTLTTSGNLPDFVQPGAKVRVTTENGEAEITISALGQSPRQAYAKGFGKVLQETILKGASKSTPMDGVLELVE